MSDDFRRPLFPRSGPPRKVKGGIRARSKRGAFARNWWARRWLSVLETLQLGGRLARGRSYARRGQVMDLEVQEGLVRARVQGSREEPYAVAIRVTLLSSAEWRRLADVLAQEAVFLARLLAGEMPTDIESAFAKAGLSLFPSRITELVTSCSCPDDSNPCKHIAAVYYLLGEEFDRDPFLIFRLRGKSRDELLLVLEELEVAAHPPPSTEDPPLPGSPDTPARSPKPNESFWRTGEIAGNFPEPGSPQEAPALLVRLGAFPFWRAPEPLPDALLPVYERAAAAALEVLADLKGKS